MSRENMKYITVVYRIDDHKQFFGINPLDLKHHGLTSVGVAAGDLMEEIDKYEYPRRKAPTDEA